LIGNSSKLAQKSSEGNLHLLDASDELEEYKEASGLANRSDVKTFFEFFEVDEGRHE